MKIGLLGGTFNPVHIGHMILAQECWSQLVLDKVIFVPARIPPLKEMEGKASDEDRMNMVRMAVEGDDRFETSSYEMGRDEESYSINTIKHFRKEYSPDTELFFLTGADAAESLSMWKDIDEILEMTNFVIATRPGWGEKSPYERKVWRIVIPQIEVSSSMIRERIRNREPIDYLVPAPVVKYIMNKGLYK